MLTEKEVRNETEMHDCYFCNGIIHFGMPYFEDEGSGKIACLTCAESIKIVMRH